MERAEDIGNGKLSGSGNVPACHFTQMLSFLLEILNKKHHTNTNTTGSQWTRTASMGNLDLSEEKFKWSFIVPDGERTFSIALITGT